jgi:YHS domain-containing protein
VVRGETARDPVCGMFVSTELSHRLTRGKETLHFCSRECLERYEKNEPQP